MSVELDRAGEDERERADDLEDERERALRAVVPFRFACHRCGNCCSGGAGYVWLEDGEEARLANALGLSTDAFEALHVRTAIDPRTGELRRALRERAGEGGAEHGGPCTLLEGKNTCTAYSARPRHCATFPHWPSVLADARAFESARATCPGIAVVAPRAVEERAFADLQALHVELGRSPDARPSSERARCCLDDADERRDTHATALEADFAIAHGRPERGCRLGPGAPLACRVRPGVSIEPWLARVRSIERSTDYPTAYASLALLLRGRTSGRDHEGNP